MSSDKSPAKNEHDKLNNYYDIALHNHISVEIYLLKVEYEVHKS